MSDVAPCLDLFVHLSYVVRCGLVSPIAIDTLVACMTRAVFELCTTGTSGDGGWFVERAINQGEVIA